METKKKYQSTRLKGIQGEWSDSEFLQYVKSRVDYRTKNTEIIDASHDRFAEIIKKLKRDEAIAELLEMSGDVQLEPFTFNVPPEHAKELIAKLKQRKLEKENGQESIQ